jgi:hypothetical protein
MAVPTYSDPIKVGHSTFYDGGIGANNPVDLAVSAAHTKWPHRSVQCLLSLGSGRQNLRRNDVSLGLMVIRRALLDIATESNSTATNFEMRHLDMVHNGAYFRFDVSPSWPEDSEPHSIGKATERYISTLTVIQRIAECASSLEQDTLGRDSVAAPLPHIDNSAGPAKFPSEQYERRKPGDEERTKVVTHSSSADDYPTSSRTGVESEIESRRRGMLDPGKRKPSEFPPKPLANKVELPPAAAISDCPEPPEVGSAWTPIFQKLRLISAPNTKGIAKSIILINVIAKLVTQDHELQSLISTSTANVGMSRMETNLSILLGRLAERIHDLDGQSIYQSLAAFVRSQLCIFSLPTLLTILCRSVEPSPASHS